MATTNQKRRYKTNAVKHSLSYK